MPTGNSQDDGHRIALLSLQLLHSSRSIAIKPYPGHVGEPRTTKNRFDAAARGAFIPSLHPRQGGGKQGETEVAPKNNQARSAFSQVHPTTWFTAGEAPAKGRHVGDKEVLPDWS